MIVGVLLAAGASRRMGRAKALVQSGGESFVVHGIRHLWSACDQVVVVLGAEAPRIRRAAGRELERLAGAGRLRRAPARAREPEPDHLEARFIVNRAMLAGGADHHLLFRADRAIVLLVTVLLVGTQFRRPTVRTNEARRSANAQKITSVFGVPIASLI